MTMTTKCAWRGISDSDSPSVTAAFELWASNPLLQLLPIVKRPVIYFEFLDFVAQIRHVLRREGLVCKSKGNSEI